MREELLEKKEEVSRNKSNGEAISAHHQKLSETAKMLDNTKHEIN